LKSKEAMDTLFKEVSPKITDRMGGYTRILKTGIRMGDNADMCVIELVDFNENMLSAKAPAKAKSTRRRGGATKKKSDAVAGTESKTTTTDEETKSE